jgi:hypothetical protein
MRYILVEGGGFVGAHPLTSLGTTDFVERRGFSAARGFAIEEVFVVGSFVERDLADIFLYNKHSFVYFFIHF